MPHPSKIKGVDYERELCSVFQDAGLRCKRARGSNGTTLRTDGGQRCESDVDLLIEGKLKVQARRRHSIAKYLKNDGAHVTVIREDRGESMAVMPLSLLTILLKRVYGDAP